MDNQEKFWYTRQEYKDDMETYRRSSYVCGFFSGVVTAVFLTAAFVLWWVYH